MRTNTYFTITFFAYLYACTPRTAPDSQLLLISAIDSLRQEIKQMKKPDKIVVVYETVSVNKPETLITKSPIKKPKEKPVIPQKKLKKQETPIYHAQKDTIKHFYAQSKKLSALVTPWYEGKREIRLYNPLGEVTFTQEDVHMSYYITTEPKAFHTNGAVASINIHLNPGASLYMYDTDITFDSNNEPLWRTTHQWPQHSLEINPPEYWDKKQKMWVKQETQPGQSPSD